MEKKLPGVFVNRISKKLTNNESVYYEKKNILNDKVVKVNKSDISVNEKINNIFSSDSYVYKMDVVIRLKDKTITKKVIGRNKIDLITIDGEIINISDILDIYPKK